MKICFIGTRGVPASYSGFETCVEQVGARMVEAGHEVVVYCRSGHYATHLPTYRGMSLRYRPAVRQKHFETLTHTAVSALSIDGNAAIICMGVGNAPVVRALELSGRRCVFNIDGADWQRKKWGRFASWYLRMSERIASHAASILVADAVTVQAYYAEHYARATEFVPYGGEPPLDVGTEALNRFHLVSGSYALFVGRLVPENGAHDFLEGVRQAGINAPAVVVGDDPFEREYLNQLHAAANGTIFTGYQFGSAYQQLTAHARLYVLGATVGGTHPVLTEQMAAGNCILARDTPSNREVLGDAGLYWTSVDELADHIGSTWSNDELRKDLGRRAQARVGSRYNWDDVTTRYLALCEATLS